MSESPKARIDPSIIAALIGLIGTVTVTLITTWNRSTASQPTAVPTTVISATEAPATELPEATSPATVPAEEDMDGNLFQLFYDDNSFYLLNHSQATIPINRVAFERLSNDDQPLNRYTGSRWAEFYSSSEPGKCMALEILGGAPYLDPPECGQYNLVSLRTPTREDPSVFWTAQEGSHEFRVLWREGGTDQEMGRCEIGAGTCQVFLP
jgi:hypothetical protein